MLWLNKRNATELINEKRMMNLAGKCEVIIGLKLSKFNT
jgi:hypothetical protein